MPRVTSLEAFLRDTRESSPSRPLQLGTTPFDRPKLVLGNILRGDPGGVGRAAFAPETLAPAQRQTLADLMGVGDGPVGKLFRVISNPLVLVGAVLALRFPVPLAKNLFRFSTKLTGLERGPGLLRVRVTGNFDAIYHGIKAGKSTLPEVMRGLMRDRTTMAQNHLVRVADAVTRFEATAGTSYTPELGKLVVAAKQGMKVKPQGAAFDRLVADLNKVTDEMYEQVFGAAESAATIRTLAELNISGSRYSGLLRARSLGQTLTGADLALFKQVRLGVGVDRKEILAQLRNVGFPSGGLEKVAKLPNYWPRQLMKTGADFEMETARLVAETAGGEKAFGKKMLAAASSVTTPHALSRQSKMLPSLADLKAIEGGLADPSIVKTVARRLAGASPPLQYSMDLLPVMESYVHSMSKAFAWTTRGRGRLIVQAGEALEASAPGKAINGMKAAMLRESYIPMALGRTNYKQGFWAAQFSEMKMTLTQQLQKPGVRGMLGSRVSDDLTKMLRDDRGVLTFRSLQGRLAGNFYVGALGMNPVSSAYNLMQTLLTTVPLIGAKATANGLTRVFERTSKYFKLRGRGMPITEARARAFPEFTTEGLAGSPLTEDALFGGLEAAWAKASHVRPNVAAQAFDRTKAAMMSMFQTSELLVRLTAFEGTLAKGLAEGLSVGEASVIARQAVQTTQFLSGPAAIPAALRNMGPLLRQFGTFPLRYADFLFGTATEVGSAAQAGGMFGLFPNRNLGTMGRALLSGGLTYETAKEFLGQDVSRGLISGALPIPQEDAPFAPFPFVPPIVSLGGGLVQDVLSGEFKKTAHQLPILVPGGVQLARMSTYFAPGVAEKLGRETVRWDLRREDGRIPLFARSGSLRGWVTPFEAYQDLLGFPPGGPKALQREQELEHFLVTQSTRMRTMRKEFIEALVLENDSKKAKSIQDSYESLYPGLGGLQVRKRDLRAVQLRVMIPRLERTLEKLPPEVRPFFGEVVQTALLNMAESFLGIDPILLSQPETQTIATRDVYRTPPPKSIMEEIFKRQLDRRLIPASRVQPIRGVSGGTRPSSGQGNPSRPQPFASF